MSLCIFLLIFLSPSSSFPLYHGIIYNMNNSSYQRSGLRGKMIVESGEEWFHHVFFFVIIIFLYYFIIKRK